MITRKQKNRSVTFAPSIGLLIALITTFNSCTPDLSDDPIPYQPFNTIIINLSLPSNVALATDGGYLERNGGVRGLIIYRQNSTTYKVFERNCSYHPNEAASTVNVDVSRLFMIDHSCGSTFRFPDGEPSGGIAWRPLRQYVVSLDGGELTITDDIIQ